MDATTFVTRVVLKNYKSIALCDVELGPLSFLVGPNGSGKSNFVDGLRLVADALRTSLDLALRDRGGIKEVRRRSGGHPTHFAIRVDFRLQDGSIGHYAFRIGAKPEGGYEVQTEECVVQSPEALGGSQVFVVKSGEVLKSTLAAVPAAASDRLFLVSASGQAPFRLLYDELANMGFYNLSPARIRDLQPPDAGQLLMRDGVNVASVLGQMALHQPEIKQRVESFLARVVPGVFGVEARALGPKEMLEFRQRVAGTKDPWHFSAVNMSDGTLRALAVLVALFQSPAGDGKRVPLVGIEEPEVALHPAAAGVLLDALLEASATRQVLVTSHSPDLLDDHKVDTDSILAVDAEQGVTQIARLDEAGKSALRDRLYTAGELLRLNQASPDLSAVSGTGTQLQLFEETDGG